MKTKIDKTIDKKKEVKTLYGQVVLWAMWTQNMDKESQLNFLKARNKAKRACRQAQKELEEVMVNNSKNNHKSFLVIFEQTERSKALHL